MKKTKLVIGSISGFLGIVAFIVASNIPRTSRRGSNPLAMNAFIDNTPIIVGFQITGAVLLVVAVLLLIFYFKGKKAE